MKIRLTIGGRPRSRGSGDRHAIGIGRDAVRQMHFPAAFVSVHAQHHARGGGRMIHGFVEQEKIVPHLPDRKGMIIDQKPHVHAGGMPAAA